MFQSGVSSNRVMMSRQAPAGIWPQSAVIAIHKVKLGFRSGGTRSQQATCAQQGFTKVPSLHVQRSEGIAKGELNLAIRMKTFHCAHRAGGLTEERNVV